MGVRGEESRLKGYRYYMGLLLGERGDAGMMGLLGKRGDTGMIGGGRRHNAESNAARVVA